MPGDPQLVEGEVDSLVDLDETRLASPAGRSATSWVISQELSAALGDVEINVDAVSSGMDSVTFDVVEDVAAWAEEVLHCEVVDHGPPSSVSVDGNVAVVRVTGGERSPSPGWRR